MYTVPKLPVPITSFTSKSVANLPLPLPPAAPPSPAFLTGTGTSMPPPALETGDMGAPPLPPLPASVMPDIPPSCVVGVIGTKAATSHGLGLVASATVFLPAVVGTAEEEQLLPTLTLRRKLGGGWVGGNRLGATRGRGDVGGVGGEGG